MVRNPHPRKRPLPLAELIAMIGGTDAVAPYDNGVFGRRAGNLIARSAPSLEQDKGRQSKWQKLGPKREGQ
jgi:hypothetical protein